MSDDLFKGFSTKGMEEQGDRLGGGFLVDSDIYKMRVKVAYVGTSKGGAMSITFLLDNNGQEYRETFYVRSKEGKPYYETKNKQQAPLPGFSIVNDICLITTEKELEQQAHDQKVLNIWDSDAKKELPKSVHVLTDLAGKEVALGIIRRKVNKAEQDSSGKWVDTAESKEENITDKVFHPELKVTVTEAKKGMEAKFWDAWLSKNKGQVPDKRTIKDDAPAASGSAPKPTSGGSAPVKKSLFGK